MHIIAAFGRETLERLETFGTFWRFAGRTLAATPYVLSRPRHLRLTLRQTFEIGVLSLPVIIVTGLFVGMVLAVQAAGQFKAAGMAGQMGAVVNLSVLRELGPVLAAVFLAGRVGGAITAELGTMRVTEQIDALRAIGAEPIRHLAGPRFIACVLMGPVLVVFANLMGILGGYYISVVIYEINSRHYWLFSARAVELFDVMTGLIKSVLFSASIALICCHQAFWCESGAAGVGRACTRGFVLSCLVILTLDFFLNVVLEVFYSSLYGFRSIIG